jgi:hypothetical protein
LSALFCRPVAISVAEIPHEQIRHARRTEDLGGEYGGAAWGVRPDKIPAALVAAFLLQTAGECQRNVIGNFNVTLPLAVSFAVTVKV